MRRPPVQVVCALIFLLLFPRDAEASTAVYVEDPQGALSQSLSLAPFDLVADPAAADVLVLSGTLRAPLKLASLLREGHNAVLIMGTGVTAQNLSQLTGEPVTVTRREDPISVNQAGGAEDPLVREIQWNSAPQLRQRLEVDGLALEPLVAAFDTGEVILSRMSIGEGILYLFTPELDLRTNRQLQEWAYFNYLIYALTQSASGAEVASFADYPGSPVPHPSDWLVLIGILAAMTITGGLAFRLVRRYSLRHPEELDALVANQDRYTQRQTEAGWEDVGFHRPLGGFLLAVMLGLVLFVPLIIYQNLILPAYVLPSAQALGIWGRVTQFFNVAWLFFDMGTSAAFFRYLAQYRVDDPRRGIMYGQLFVWWQALSGAIQVALIVLLASTVLPRSAYAIYSWSVILHAFIQIPGYYLVYRHALTGFQRFDYAQLVDMAQQALLPIVTQIPIVILMVRWGQGRPVFGPAMGGLLGMGLAAYATELLCFLLGWWLYRRVGLRSRVLFLAHFDGAVVRSALRFGGFEMLGSLAWAGGQAAEVAITQGRLINYAETWGNWVIAQNFVFGFNVINILYYNLVASISEAISHGRRVLSEYYAAQAYRYGGIFSAFIAAVLLAVADRFILGATGPEFVRASVLATPLILWGAIQYPSWVSDAVQLGTNRPYLKALMVAGEQVIRITLAAIFLARFQIWALIGAYFVGLLAKGMISFIVNDRVCFRQRLYAWPALVAPLLAGILHYAVVRGVTGVIWRGDQATSVLILFLGILPSFPLYAFFYGLLGGWDDQALAELRKGAALAGIMRPLAMLFWHASRLGADASPLHGRFVVAIQETAEREAAGLQADKVQLGAEE